MLDANTHSPCGGKTDEIIADNYGDVTQLKEAPVEFVPLLVMSALVKKIVDFAKYLTSMDINALVTQALSWGAGVAVAFIGANSDWGQTIQVNGTALGALNGWSLALVGFNLASVAGIGWDVIKSWDNTNSAVVPNLLGRVPEVRQGVPGSPAPTQEVR